MFVVFSWLLIIHIDFTHFNSCIELHWICISKATSLFPANKHLSYNVLLNFLYILFRFSMKSFFREYFFILTLQNIAKLIIKVWTVYIPMTLWKICSPSNPYHEAISSDFVYYFGIDKIIPHCGLINNVVTYLFDFYYLCGFPFINYVLIFFTSSLFYLSTFSF